MENTDTQQNETKQPEAQLQSSSQSQENGAKVSAYFSSLSELVNELCPGSRERAIAITNLEQALRASGALGT